MVLVSAADRDRPGSGGARRQASCRRVKAISELLTLAALALLAASTSFSDMGLMPAPRHGWVKHDNAESRVKGGLQRSEGSDVGRLDAVRGVRVLH